MTIRSHAAFPFNRRVLWESGCRWCFLFSIWLAFMPCGVNAVFFGPQKGLPSPKPGPNNSDRLGLTDNFGRSTKPWLSAWNSKSKARPRLAKVLVLGPLAGDAVGLHQLHHVLGFAEGSRVPMENLTGPNATHSNNILWMVEIESSRNSRTE